MTESIPSLDQVPTLSAQQQDAIIEALGQRGATGPCPRCGHGNFQLLGQFANMPLTTSPNVTSVAGPTLPTVVVICTNCGHAIFHAFLALDLLDDPAFAQYKQDREAGL